jgi:phage tail sheath protein FI
MATNYKTPGVYIEEISKLPASIAAVETAIPAFMGRTEFAKDENGNDILPTVTKLPTPIRITSFLDYQKYFGGANSETSVFQTTGIPTITDTEVAGKVVKRIMTCDAKKSAASGRYMYYAIQMFYANGGGPCYIVSSGNYASTITNVAAKACLDAVAKVDEPTMLVLTDKHTSFGATSGYKDVYDYALAQCAKLQDRIAIFDAWVLSDSPFTDAGVIRDDISADYLKYGAVYYPWLQSTLSYGYNDSIVIKHLVNGVNGPYNDATLSAKHAMHINTYRA